MTASPLHTRATLEVVWTATEIADRAARFAADTAGPHAPGDRIRRARELRVKIIALMDQVVLETLAGSSGHVDWYVINAALGRPIDQVEETRRQYEPTWLEWQTGLADVV